MTAERLNQLQVDIAQCDKNVETLLEQVNVWQAKKVAYQGAYEEAERNAGGFTLAGAFTAWACPGELRLAATFTGWYPEG